MRCLLLTRPRLKTSKVVEGLVSEITTVEITTQREKNYAAHQRRSSKLHC